MFEVKGSVALITGGASGIGHAIAKELLSKEAKAVSLVDIVARENVLKELQDEFGHDRVIFIKTDVADSQQLEDAFENTIKIFDQLDLVFNNAGIVDELNWERAINTNLVGCIRGTMLAIEKYLPKYSKKAFSVVVNTASLAAVQPAPFVPVYSATKCGIVSFTKNMAILHEKSMVRVIAICPGGTQTPILVDLLKNVPERNRKMMEAALEETCCQEPKIVASHVVGMLGSAPSGSIWSIENNEVQRIELSF